VDQMGYILSEKIMVYLEGINVKGVLTGMYNEKK